MFPDLRGRNKWSPSDYSTESNAASEMHSAAAWNKWMSQAENVNRFEAVKPLEGKTRYELLPADALEEVAAVLTFGAKKRGENNWTKGQHWTRYIGALLRHTYAFSRGEEVDVETGRSHMAHAICCALFLLAYQLRKIGTDDRDSAQSKGV